MKRITVIFLILAMLALFASCNDDNNPTTTMPPIATGYVPSDPGTTTPSDSTGALTETTSEVPTASSVGVTYILTTRADKTVPWSETTRFDHNTVIVPTTTGSYLTGAPDVNPTAGNIQKPSVNTSQLPTQQTATTPTADPFPTGATSTTKGTITTKEKTTKATTAANKTPTQLVINDTSYNSSTSLVTLAVSTDGWMSAFAAKSQNISIIVDGEKIPTTVPCSVTSKTNADGCQLITIDLSSQSLNSGSNVTFTIPAGLVQTKAGTQYNTSYTGYVVI
ncbi:MAG: hypothetical protein II356_07580 [Clostridia bacterium]|nr:hypothetical protein [Clostridia bacterium]